MKRYQTKPQVEFQQSLQATVTELQSNAYRRGQIDEHLRIVQLLETEICEMERKGQRAETIRILLKKI